MLETVELFSGIGGIRLAADSLGLRTVWANDISPEACKVYRSRFGDNELHQGDITQLKGTIPAHDLLTAGFPCQPFSSAGKKLGIEDPRGTLFEVIVEILELRRPPHFILENVKRLLSMHTGWHFATILAALSRAKYFVEWRLLNAMDFGLPQFRQRVVVIGTREDLLQGKKPIRLAPPSDLGELKRGDMIRLLDSNLWWDIRNHGKGFPSWGIAQNDRYFGSCLNNFSSQKKQRKLVDVLQQEVDSWFDFTEDTTRRIQESESVNRFYNGVQLLWNQGGGARMGYTVFGTEGIAPTLTASASRHYERYHINGRFRRLTNIEYARLQGFPDDHCQEVSVYDQYALYGNAVPPPLIGWAIGRLFCDPVSPVQEIRQMDLLAEING